jgi:hypothetical protein
MITVETGLYVRIEEMQGERAPQPRPLASGFSRDVAYRVLGVHAPSETSEAYLILANDRDELWFISNRHVRAQRLERGHSQLGMPLRAPAPVSVLPQ